MQPRFTIGLQVNGTLVPGQPITIVATTRAIFPASSVRLRLSTPEIDAARSSGWGADFQVPVDVHLPPLTETETALARGGSRTQSAVVQVSVPGYYRVLASASEVGQGRELANGSDIQDFVVKEMWLLITPEGGRITERFDPSVFPDSVLKQPGPFRSVSGVAVAQGGRVSTQSIGTRTWTVVFLDNNDSSSYKPLAWATVSGSVTTGTDTWPVSTVTNGSGSFTTQCSTDRPTFNALVVDAEDAHVRVTPNTEVVDVVKKLSGCGPSQLIALSDPSKVFSIMRTTALAAEAQFVRSRPQLEVKIDPLACDSVSCYVSDLILLVPGHVWGYSGLMTQAHEYGHAFQALALGGIPPNDLIPSSDCRHHGGPVYTSLSCAYWEGFPEYFEVLVWPDTANRYSYTPETDQDLLANLNPFPEDLNNPDGSIIEGAVQAFFYDLTDPANEPFDAVAYPARYVGDLMATCKVFNGENNVSPRGIDHLIRCLEQQVDPSVNGYFYYRAPPSISETESATEPPDWSRSNIRTLWLKDLYNQ